MTTEYLPNFIKNLKKPNKTPIYPEIRKLAFQTIPDCHNISEIKNQKKIKGHKNAYRIRMGDYRLGIFIDNERITLSRVLHRKDVYHYFP